MSLAAKSAGGSCCPPRPAPGSRGELTAQASANGQAGGPLHQGTATTEVLLLRADWLVGLPVASQLVLSVPGVPGHLRIGLGSFPLAGALNADEWLALVRAAESGRALPSDLRTWAKLKAADPAWKLTADNAMGGRIYNASPRRWSVGAVLEALDASLEAVLVYELDQEGARPAEAPGGAPEPAQRGAP